MAKELGLSKSGMISVALENYKKRSRKKKSHCNGSKAKYFGLIIPYGKRKSKILHTFLLYPDSIPEDWEMKLSYWGFRWQSVRYMIRI